MRFPNGQNAKYDPVIMAQQVELPFTESLQAGILLLALPGKSISTSMYCTFVKRVDIFQNINNHFLWMDKIMGDTNVLSFSTVYFSIYLINHNEHMFLT